MAGPFPIGYIKNAKVNGFISVVKSDGSRRQVGNLSAPEGRSFDNGIDPGVLKEWKVTQTTSRGIADKILRAGKNAVLTAYGVVEGALKCQSRPKIRIKG